MPHGAKPNGMPPTHTHAGFYTEVAHYLEAIQPAGSNDADTVVGHCAR